MKDPRQILYKQSREDWRCLNDQPGPMKSFGGRGNGKPSGHLEQLKAAMKERTGG